MILGLLVRGVHAGVWEAGGGGQGGNPIGHLKKRGLLLLSTCGGFGSEQLESRDLAESNSSCRGLNLGPLQYRYSRNLFPYIMQQPLQGAP